MIPHLDALKDFHDVTKKPETKEYSYSKNTLRFKKEIASLFGADAAEHPQLKEMFDKIEWSEDQFLREHENGAVILNQLMLQFMEKPATFPAWQVLKLLEFAKACYTSARSRAAAFDKMLIEKRLLELKEISIKLHFDNAKSTWRG